MSLISLTEQQQEIVDGQNYWQWLFQTPPASYYVIDPSRSTQVITAMLEAAVPEG